MNYDYTESQTCELKRVWKDEYLKTLCAFANGDGGMLVVGVDDSGAVVGLSDVKGLMEVVPNKILNRLGILGDVHVRSHDGKEILEIAVAKTYAPVSVGGKFYKRSGSMTVELNGAELSRFH